MTLGLGLVLFLCILGLGLTEPANRIDEENVF
jgi:hypothetical protein